MIAVFLDRDGTIGGHGGGILPEDFTLYDYSAKAIQKLNEAGIKVFLLTNQSWIGSHTFTEDRFLLGYQRLQDELGKSNAFIDEMYYCPHRPEDHCDCRKPSPKLILDAQKTYGLCLERSYVIGDRLSDIVCAQNAGCHSILVETSRGKDTVKVSKQVINEQVKATPIFKNVLEATEWLLRIQSSQM